MPSVIPAADLRLLVGRIADHPLFAEAPRHRHLLRYLADHAIATGGEDVTLRRIEADVLTTSAGVPRTPPISPRALVADVRLKLDRYAASAGHGDSLRLSIDPGECRLRITRRTPSPPGLVSDTPPQHPTLVVVDFDAEPAAERFVGPLAEAIGHSLGDLAGMAVVRQSRRTLWDRGLAVEQAAAAWQAVACVHGMALLLPGEEAGAWLGASVRLLGPAGNLVWTLWCEEPVGDDDGVAAVAAIGDAAARFVVDATSAATRAG
ncbi:MAG: hypothetical protein ACKO4T_09285 [Planctomycetaceae bacterium]